MRNLCECVKSGEEAGNSRILMVPVFTGSATSCRFEMQRPCISQASVALLALSMTADSSKPQLEPGRKSSSLIFIPFSPNTYSKIVGALRSMQIKTCTADSSRENHLHGFATAFALLNSAFSWFPVSTREWIHFWLCDVTPCQILQPMIEAVPPLINFAKDLTRGKPSYREVRDALF